MDFERASINAFQQCFPSATLKGCFFHFAQANWRKIQELGLSNQYRNDVGFRTTVKSFVALALIPENDAVMGLEALCEDLNDSPITPYVEYFEDTCHGQRGFERNEDRLCNALIQHYKEERPDQARLTNEAI